MATQKDSRASELIETLKRKINERGPKGILGLIKIFKEMDKNKTGKINKEELKAAIKSSIKQGVDSNDVEVIFKELDTDKDNLISQNELLKLLKGTMNEERKKIVTFVFNLLKPQKTDHVNIIDMKKKYNKAKHPAVLAGRKMETQVEEELTNTIDLYKECYDIKGEVLTKGQFIDLYSNLSTSIDNDKYFEEMMRNCWGINQEQLKEINEAHSEPLLESSSEETKEKVVVKKVKKEVLESSEEMKVTPSVQKFRDAVIPRGVKSILGVERQFKIYSKDDCLELDNIKKIAEDFRLQIDPKDLETLFKELNKTEKGKVECSKLLQILLGEMSEHRRQLVEAAFPPIDKDNDGIIDREDISRIYEAWKDPGVKSGKRRTDDVLHEVLEVLDNATALHRGSKTDGRYTKEEFINYFGYISACTPNDNDFGNIFTTFWRVDKSKLPSIEKKEEKKVIEVESVNEDNEDNEDQDE